MKVVRFAQKSHKSIQNLFQCFRYHHQAKMMNATQPLSDTIKPFDRHESKHLKNKTTCFAG